MTEIRLLTTGEVSKIIRKSTSWLVNSRWAGGGPPYRKLGRSVVYEYGDVLEWIEEHEKQTSSSTVIENV